MTTQDDTPGVRAPPAGPHGCIPGDGLGLHVIKRTQMEGTPRDAVFSTRVTPSEAGGGLDKTRGPESA